MNSKKSQNSFVNSPHRQPVVDLITALGQGLKPVVSSLDLPQGIALQELTLELSQGATRENTCGSVNECLKSLLGEETDLESVRIVTQGRHSVTDEFVIATGDAIVSAGGVGVVIALGKARVFARDRVAVFAADHTTNYMYDYTTGRLSGQAKVYSYNHSRGFADEWVVGVVRDRSKWTLSGEAYFDSHDNVVMTCKGESQLRAYGSTHVYGRESANVRLFDRTKGWFMNHCSVELNGETIVYTQPTATVIRKSGASKHLPLARVFVALAAG